ncbi:MAG: hypothetical protein QXZ28_01915, partial [Candidatus Methanomethylicaceae archaeon]
IGRKGELGLQLKSPQPSIILKEINREIVVQGRQPSRNEGFEGAIRGHRSAGGVRAEGGEPKRPAATSLFIIFTGIIFGIRLMIGPTRRAPLDGDGRRSSSKTRRLPPDRPKQVELLLAAAAAVRMPWIAHVYFELLDYAEQIGADPRTMDALSDLVSNVYESIRSLGSQTQLFKVACIVNSVILPLSIAMVVEVIVKLFSEVMKASQLTNVPLPVGLSFIPPESIPIISTIAYSSVILNSYFIGLLGGKVSNGGSVTDGLLIATVCVFISTLSLFLFVDLSLISFVFPAVVQ